jgi:hypothetical protein
LFSSARDVTLATRGVMSAPATPPAVDPRRTVPLGQIGRRVDWGSTAVAALLTFTALALLVGNELASAGASIGEWDLLFFSGCITVVGGLWLARGQPERFDAMLERLANRRALEDADGDVSYSELTSIQTAIDDRARRWGRWFGFGLAVLIGLAFVGVNAARSGDAAITHDVLGPVVGALGGFLVGRPLGRMLSYSLLSRFLAHEKLCFRARPGHVDGAAGLKPLGDYYLYQALLLALPAAFLLVWSVILLIPSWEERYPGWRETYLGLLVVAICIELVGFAAPLWRVHEVMKRQKREALVKADRALGPAIAEERKRLEQDLESDQRAAGRDRLLELTSSYEAIENMPTWPLDRAVRRRLTLGNIALVVPLVSQVTALAAR